MTQDLHTQLTDLISRTGSAHGVYEENELNGVYDQEWAAWYAAWAIENGLNELLGTALDVDTLGPLLTQYHAEHQGLTTGEGWPGFYARRLIEAYQ